MAAAVMENAAEQTTERRPRGPKVDDVTIINALMAANGAKTADEVAEECKMEVATFNQRLYKIRDHFRDTPAFRQAFANQYGEKGELPKWLTLKQKQLGRVAGAKLFETVQNILGDKAKVADTQGAAPATGKSRAK